jgi:anti-anti-sigma factor
MQPAPDAGSFTSRRVGASVEIQASGDLDMAATFKLEPEVERLLAQDGVRRLVLDLADVRFIDSAGSARFSRSVNGRNDSVLNWLSPTSQLTLSACWS